MNRKLIAVGAFLVVALVATGGAWGLGWFGHEDSELDEIKEMIADGPPSKEQGEAIRQVIDKKTAGMTEDQKGAYLRETMMPLFMSMMAKRFSEEYDKLMAMSEEDRNRELDRRIDEMKTRRRPPGAPGGPGGPGGGRPPGPPPSAEQMNSFRVKMLDIVSPDQRAKMEGGMKLMQARMKERGITAPPGPGGGFF
jgi:hypothetical protein